MSPIDSADGPAGRPDTDVLHLTDPADVMSAIPFLLGFHPEESLVVLVLARMRLVVTARVDIGQDPTQIGRQLSAVAGRHGGDTAVAVGYSVDPAYAGRVVEALVHALQPLEVAAALVADGRRWWQPRCSDTCLIDDGTPYDLDVTEVARRAALAGMPALPSRAALADSVAGPPEEERAALAGIFREASAVISDLTIDERATWMSLLVEEHCVHQRALTTRRCADLAVLAGDVSVRDVAAERIRAEDAAIHVDLWRQVVGHTIAPFEPAPLCLLALAGWVVGNGALQVVCMERAEVIDPGYSLLKVLDEINVRCIPPSAWRGIWAG